MATQLELSIVIPAYNESGRILPTLEQAREYLATAGEWGGRVEVLVVCDGCTDDTEQVVRAWGKLPNLRVIAYRKNQGKGYAVRTGVLASQGRVVVFTDADGATPFREISLLAAPLLAEDCEVVIGSRRVPGARVTGTQPWRRRVLGRFFGWATRNVLGVRFADTQCGFKLFRGEIARSLFESVRCPGFGFDLEVLVLAQERGLHIVEAGVEWHDQAESKVSPLRDGMRMLRTLWSLRRQSRRRVALAAAKAPALSR